MHVQVRSARGKLGNKGALPPPHLGAKLGEPGVHILEVTATPSRLSSRAEQKLVAAGATVAAAPAALGVSEGLRAGQGAQGAGTKRDGMRGQWSCRPAVELNRTAQTG